jgi:TDG/mug DNA glycosylase family protein
MLATRYPFPTLPDDLRPGLRLVLVGINPGTRSVARGHYFSSPNSRFWPAFSASRLAAPIRRALGVPALGPEHDGRLLDFGIGFTDVVKRPSANASGLTARDVARWAPVCLARLRRYRPVAVCFHGRTAWEHFLRGAAGQEPPARFLLGPQAPLPALGATRCFVVPNPSGANAHYPLAALTAGYDRLADFLDETGPGAAARISSPPRPGATMTARPGKEPPWSHPPSSRPSG